MRGQGKVEKDMNILPLEITIRERYLVYLVLISADIWNLQ